ncbi:MAG UNVERIFIED_CONTAM: ATP-binding cassette domain-containing protein, partial [Thermobifida fusca]
MIIASDLELRVGARLLLAPASFQVGPGDRIGLVGRNGAGKTTLTKVLAGEAIPAAGKVTRTGTVGYLPQDPRTGDLDVVARDRILSARGIDEVLRQLRVAEQKMASEVPKIRDQGVRAYARLEERLHVLGGYAAEAEAASIASSLGLEQRILTQPLRTLSGGQRRRVE